MTRRFRRLLTAFALSLTVPTVAAAAAAPALAATASAPAAAPAATGTQTGWIRLAHLSPNAPAVDVYLYSLGNSKAMIVLHHVSYGTVSGYEAIPAGDYTVAMRAAGKPASSAPVLSTSVDVLAGHAYTVAGMGPAAGLRLQVLDDVLTTPKGRALVRVIQASLKQTRITVTAGGQVLARNLAFGSATSYISVPPGTVEVHASGATMSTSSSLTLSADTTHTIVVLDEPSGLGLDPLTDAAGSGLMPTGGPATGFGGMAPRPGDPLPWLVAAGVGALVTLGAALRLRQARRSGTAPAK